jgi:hypothetical protein
MRLQHSMKRLSQMPLGFRTHPLIDQTEWRTRTPHLQQLPGIRAFSAQFSQMSPRFPGSRIPLALEVDASPASPPEHRLGAF